MTGNKKTLARLLELQDKMTLRTFSEKCEIGQSTMHNYLHGRDIKLTMAVKICKANGRSLDWLVGNEDTPQEGMTRKFKILAHQVRSQADSTEELLKALEKSMDSPQVDNHATAERKIRAHKASG